MSCATTRPLPNFFSMTSGWLFRTRAMTCTRAVFGRLPVILERVVVVDHNDRQETVAPAGEDLEKWVLRDLHVGRRSPRSRSCVGNLSGAGKMPCLIVIETIVVEGAIGIRRRRRTRRRHRRGRSFRATRARRRPERGTSSRQTAACWLSRSASARKAGRFDVWLPTGAGVAAGGEGERKLVAAAAIFRAVDDQDGTGGGQIAGEVAAVVDVDGIGAEARPVSQVAADAGELHAELVRDFVAGRDVVEHEGGQGVAILFELHGDAAGGGIAVVGDGDAHPHFDAGGTNAGFGRRAM